MKPIYLIILCLIGISPFSAKSIQWNEQYVFEENGKYGLMVNEEVCVLPTFDKLTAANGLFIYTDENGKQGLLGRDRIILPAIYDEILDAYNTGGNTFVLYKDGDETGLIQLGRVRKYINIADNKMYSDTVPEVQILAQGKYRDFKSVKDVNEIICDNDLLFCIDNSEDINIIDLKYGINFTPYFDLKKLKGNIKDVLNGKVPYSKLKIKRYGSNIHEDFDKILKKHPELKPTSKPLSIYYKVINATYKYDKDEIIDSITQGSYKGVITTDGVISIPLEYSSLEDVLSRNPNNVMGLATKLDEEMDKYKPRMEDTWGLNSDQRFEVYKDYYNNLYSYYEACIPAWESLNDFAATNPATSKAMKDYLDKRISTLRQKRNEAANEAGRYNKVASVTGAMRGLSSSLSAIASSMTFNQPNAQTSVSSYSSGNYNSHSTNSDKSVQGTGFSLSEQTSYNRDKKTYERYDSQLASHFAGNQVMSQTAVDNAQREMKRLRTKWESRGKSFTQSPNETR